MRLPVSPPGQAHMVGRNWRPGSELNRRTRLCRPLHNHSATWPVTRECQLSAWQTRIKQNPGGRGLSTNWSGKRDSNSRPRPWQGRALPTELFPRKLHIFGDVPVPVNPDFNIRAETGEIPVFSAFFLH